MRNKSKTIQLLKSGDVCDSGDHKSNGKDKEELVQQQQEENCEAESRDNSNGDIYSDSDDEDKRKDKEDLIEEKEKCEEQSKDNLTHEGGDVCDSGDNESNGKEKEELVQQQQENCEAESKDNSTGIICELHVGEGIRIGIHEEMEETERISYKTKEGKRRIWWAI